MIRNDLHVHSVRSLCGFHAILEIVEIAASKGMRSVTEIDENEQIEKPLKSMKSNGNDMLFNRKDELLHQFLEGRKNIRVNQLPSGRFSKESRLAD